MLFFPWVAFIANHGILIVERKTYHEYVSLSWLGPKKNPTELCGNKNKGLKGQCCFMLPLLNQKNRLLLRSKTKTVTFFHKHFSIATETSKIPVFCSRKTQRTEMFANENLLFRTVFNGKNAFSELWGTRKLTARNPFFRTGAFSGGVILLKSSCVQPSLLKKTLPQITNQPWFPSAFNQFHIPEHPTIFPTKKKHTCFPLK